MARRNWNLALLLLCVLTVAAAPVTMADSDRIEIKSITYSASMGRDPFEIPDFSERDKQVTSEKLDLRLAKLVGVVKGPDGLFALLEDEHGESYTILKGDLIRFGRVSRIEENHIEAWVRINGLRQKIRLNLTKEGD
jgi:hypothetical protein